MRAIVCEKFGSGDVLEMKNPENLGRKIMRFSLESMQTTVASEDPGMRSSRGLNGIRKPNRNILGFYLAGEVEVIGKAVKRFKVGYQVYGNTGLSLLGNYI